MCLLCFHPLCAGGSDSEEACDSASEEKEVRRCAATSEGGRGKGSLRRRRM